jgi:gluconate 2-dehydrogenase gamma chain
MKTAPNVPPHLSPITRRDALKLITSAPAAAALIWTPAEAEQAQSRAQQSRATSSQAKSAAFQPKFFAAHEYATVAVLVDLIIPRDERSGSATDAGVPEFMDFMMVDDPRRQVAMRGGLALIDHLCNERFGHAFLDCTDAERRQMLDVIAFPLTAPPSLANAVAFFSSFRDLIASGFWTTKMGVEDLRYQGNTFVSEWNGCPPAALEKLGVRYE